MLNSLMSDPGLVLLILFIFMLVCRVPIAISLGLPAAIVSWLCLLYTSDAADD